MRKGRLYIRKNSDDSIVTASVEIRIDDAITIARYMLDFYGKVDETREWVDDGEFVFTRDDEVTAELQKAFG